MNFRFNVCMESILGDFLGNIVRRLRSQISIKSISDMTPSYEQHTITYSDMTTHGPQGKEVKIWNT